MDTFDIKMVFRDGSAAASGRQQVGLGMNPKGSFNFNFGSIVMRPAAVNSKVINEWTLAGDDVIIRYEGDDSVGFTVLHDS